MTISQIANRAFRSLNSSSPVILSGLAVAGVVSTAIFASKATVEAVASIDFATRNDDKLPLKEQAKLVWRLYLPTAGMGVATIVCIIGAQSINSRRQAALISGFTIAETSFREYRDKTIELQGANADTKIRDSIQQDRVLADPSSSEILILGQGHVLCYDKYSGRYFESDREEIRQAQNNINEAMLNGDMYASLNDFYGQIGLPPTKMGEGLGWSTENLLDLNFSSVLTGRGEPCLAIDFRTEPMQDYYKFR